MTIKRNRRPGDLSKAVAILRASTTDQRVSPEAQRRSIEAWAKRENVEVVAWHTEAVSGATPIEDRHGLLAALADVERHGCGRLVASKRDRLARDVVLAALIERLAERVGARIYTADGMDAEGPEGVLMRGIVDVFASYERLLIGHRTRAALQTMKAKGLRVGTLPFGFSVASDGKTLIENEAEQKIITNVRRLRAKGLTIRAVVRECQRRAILSRSGRPLGKSQVERLLRAA